MATNRILGRAPLDSKKYFVPRETSEMMLECFFLSSSRCVWVFTSSSSSSLSSLLPSLDVGVSSSETGEDVASFVRVSERSRCCAWVCVRASV